jgi:hypothetical protein
MEREELVASRIGHCPAPEEGLAPCATTTFDPNTAAKLIEGQGSTDKNFCARPLIIAGVV